MKLIFILLINTFLAMSIVAKTFTKEHKFYDGHNTKVYIDKPNNKKSKNTVLLIHDSGPLDHKMKVQINGKEYNYFEEIKQFFLANGMEVVSFDKRSFNVFQKALTNPAYVQSVEFKNVEENILDYTHEDVTDIATNIIKEKLNKKDKGKLYLFGVGQGALIALRTAERLKDKIDGLILVGLTGKAEEAMLVSRIYNYFRDNFLKYDTNKDNSLTRKELKGVKELEGVLNTFKYFDIDKDNKLTIDEIDGINYLKIIEKDQGISNYAKINIRYNTAYSILQTIETPTALIHGLKDQLNPVHELYAVYYANLLKWKNQALSFGFLINEDHYLNEYGKQIGSNILSKNAKNQLIKTIQSIQEYDKTKK